MVGETTQVPRVENQTPPTLEVEPIAPKIHVPEKNYYTNHNDTNVNFTGRSTDVAPTPH